MRLYLDNCMFNRPFDDQSHLKILLESEAKLKIQEYIRAEKYELVWSYILDYENNKNPFRERREQIEKWSNYSVIDIVANPDILELSVSIEKLGLKKFDSLHLACAIYGKADYFLTTDNGILKKAKLIQKLEVIDPINYIREVFE